MGALRLLAFSRVSQNTLNHFSPSCKQCWRHLMSLYSHMHAVYIYFLELRPVCDCSQLSYLQHKSKLGRQRCRDLFPSSPPAFFECSYIWQPGQEQGSPSEARSQQLDKYDIVAVVRGGGGSRSVIPRLIDGSSAGGSLNQHPAESLANVGLTFSVFISCTHMDRREEKKCNLHVNFFFFFFTF